MPNTQLLMIELARNFASFQNTLQLACQVDIGGFGFVNPDGSILLSGPSGRKTNLLLGVEPPQGVGLGWMVVEKRKPWQLNDYISSNDIRHDNFIDKAVALEEIKASFATPLYHDNKIIGIIYSWSRDRMGFSSNQLSQINALAEIISKNEQIGSHLAHNRLPYKDLVHYIDFYLGADSNLIDYYDYVVESMLSGKDPESILHKLASLVDSPVILISRQLSIIASTDQRISGKLTQAKSPILFPLVPQFNIPLLISFTDRNGRFWIGAPIKGSASILGYLGVLLEKPVSFREIRLIKASCLGLALLEKQQTKAWDEDFESRREFLEQLLNETRASDRTLLDRSISMGLDLQASNKLTVLSFYKQLIAGKLDSKYLKKFFNKQHIFYGQADKYLVFITPNKQEGEPENSIKAFLAASGRNQDTEEVVAIASKCEKLGDYSLKYREICSLIDFWPTTGFRNQIINLDDIGPIRLFLKPGNQSFLEQNVYEILGPLLTYDKKKGSDLTNTLDCYFENNCIRKETAQRLYIHEHTLDYRLKKIQELINIDLYDYAKRFHIHFALEALKTLRLIGFAQ